MKQRIKKLFVGGVLACVVFGAAMAGPLEDGVTAFQHGDYATAMRLLRPFAEEGNASAQVGLGVMCENGWGEPPDGAQAAAWYRKAAEQGNADAQESLGNMYEHGEWRDAGLCAGSRLVPEGCRARERRRPVQPRHDVRHWPWCAAGLEPSAFGFTHNLRS